MTQHAALSLDFGGCQYSTVNTTGAITTGEASRRIVNAKLSFLSRSHTFPAVSNFESDMSKVPPNASSDKKADRQEQMDPCD